MEINKTLTIFQTILTMHKQTNAERVNDIMINWKIFIDK